VEAIRQAIISRVVKNHHGGKSIATQHAFGIFAYGDFVKRRTALSPRISLDQ
jgi:hypothetical protein